MCPPLLKTSTAQKVSAFRVILNTEGYGVSLRNSECGKIRARITPNTETFYAVEEMTRKNTSLSG